MKKIKWKEITTSQGFRADEVISALQKEIRRGHLENAIYWARELCLSGDIFEKKFWERMSTIVVEDIGLANPNAVLLINTVKQAYYSKYEHPDDRLLHALFAAAYLAKSKKDRYIDEIKNYFNIFPQKKTIPDYALDKHTKRGKELGRGDLHFWQTAAIIKPEIKGRNTKYLKSIIKHFHDSSK
ncbi:MAG: hypothetical protein WC686_02930 [Candidatus Shapirobacteria bacterium]|jgi:replication-associated recombination protein RarA